MSRQGEYREALENILLVLGDGDCSCNSCKGCKYEIEEVRREARSVLGLPVPRERCNACGSLDQIWARNYGPFVCHACGVEAPESEWVDLPADS